MLNCSIRMSWVYRHLMLKFHRNISFSFMFAKNLELVKDSGIILEEHVCFPIFQTSDSSADKYNEIGMRLSGFYSNESTICF